MKRGSTDKLLKFSPIFSPIYYYSDNLIKVGICYSQKSAANGWRDGGGSVQTSPSPLSTWLSDVFTSDSSNVQSSQYLLIFTIFLLLHF